MKKRLVHLMTIMHSVHMPTKTNDHRLVAFVPKKAFSDLRKKLFNKGQTISSWLREKINEAVK